MKYLLLAALYFIPVLPVLAQKNDSIPGITPPGIEKKNELGLFGQAFFSSSNDEGQALMGLQFKRWVKPFLAYRISAGYNPYSYNSDTRIEEGITKDTVKVRRNQSEADLFFIGFGLEVQRKFYKRLYFFATVDVLGGYGTGHAYGYSYKAPLSSWSGYYNPTHTDYKEERYERAYLRVLPSVGAKLAFNRISFGAEAGFMKMSLEHQNLGNKYAYAVADFSLFNSYTTYRLFVHYRF